jgi:hypothetical protein
MNELTQSRMNCATHMDYPSVGFAASDGLTWSKTTHCVVFSLFDPRFRFALSRTAGAQLRAPSQGELQNCANADLSLMRKASPQGDERRDELRLRRMNTSSPPSAELPLKGKPWNTRAVKVFPFEGKADREASLMRQRAEKRKAFRG